MPSRVGTGIQHRGRPIRVPGGSEGSCQDSPPHYRRRARGSSSPPPVPLSNARVRLGQAVIVRRPAVSCAGAAARRRRARAHLSPCASRKPRALTIHDDQRISAVRRAAFNARNSRRSAAVCDPASRFSRRPRERLRPCPSRARSPLQHQPRQRERPPRVGRARNAARRRSRRFQRRARADRPRAPDTAYCSASSANWRIAVAPSSSATSAASCFERLSSWAARRCSRPLARQRRGAQRAAPPLHHASQRRPQHERVQPARAIGGATNARSRHSRARTARRRPPPPLAQNHSPRGMVARRRPAACREHAASASCVARAWHRHLLCVARAVRRLATAAVASAWDEACTGLARVSKYG